MKSLKLGKKGMIIPFGFMRRASAVAGLTTISAHPTLTNNLQFYWNANNNTLDLSGNGNDATLVNGATYATGKLQNGFSFDRVNDYANIPDSLLSGTNFTFAMWFEIDTLSSTLGSGQAIWWAGQTIAFARRGGLQVRSSDDKLQLGQIGSTAIVSDSAVTAGTQYHVGVVKSGGNVTMYVNGVAQADTGTGYGTYSSTDGHLAVAATNLLNVLFGGVIDEVYFSSDAKSASEMSDLYNSGAGLPYSADNIVYHPTLMVDMVNVYEMEGNGTDSLGNNNATVNGAIETTGKINKGLSYDGTNDNLTLVDNVNTSTFSVGGWINRDVTGAYHGFYAKYLSGSSLRTIQSFVKDDDKFAVWICADNNCSTRKQYETTATIGASTWTHLAFVWDAGTLTLYINGAEATVTKVIDSSFTAFTNNSLAPTFGSANNGAFLDGTSDEVCIAHKAWTASEVSNLYNSNAGLKFNT